MNAKQLNSLVAKLRLEQLRQEREWEDAMIFGPQQPGGSNYGSVGSLRATCNEDEEAYAVLPSSASCNYHADNVPVNTNGPAREQQQSKEQRQEEEWEEAMIDAADGYGDAAVAFETEYSASPNSFHPFSTAIKSTTIIPTFNSEDEWMEAMAEQESAFIELPHYRMHPQAAAW